MGRNLLFGIAALVALSLMVLTALQSPEHYDVLMLGPLSRQYFDSNAQRMNGLLDVSNGMKARGQMLSLVDSGMTYSGAEEPDRESSRLKQDRPDRTPILTQTTGKADIQALVQDVTGNGGDFAAAAHWNSNRLPQDRPSRPKARVM